MRVSRRVATSALVLAPLLLASGCSGTSETAEDPTSGDPTGPSAAGGSASADAGQWPRTIEHAAGRTEIPARPTTIVSTSPSLTGSLLALGAPLVSSAAAPVTELTDDKGFFVQWASVADDAGVEVLFTNFELDLDAVEAAAPDLIIGSVSGADSVQEAYDQLSEIAPTVLLDYSTATWQETTTVLGSATGMEKEAVAVESDFDAFVAEQASKLSLPEQPVTALAYLGADGVWAYDEDSPQADLLGALGFEYTAPPKEVSEQSAGSGVAVVSAENMPAALADAQTILVVPIASEDEVSGFASDPLVANLPSVTDGRVVSFGSQAFRLDYYSAKATAEHLVSTFAK